MCVVVDMREREMLRAHPSSSAPPIRFSYVRPTAPQEWPERYTVDAFGGKRELGESSLEAAVRETREESGGAIRLDDARRFVRLPALDMRCVRALRRLMELGWGWRWCGCGGGGVP